MSILYYQDERDEDFFEVCEVLKKEYPSLGIRDIVLIAVNSPAKSFYIRKGEYRHIIRKGVRELPKNRFKREKHRAIIREHYRLTTLHPELYPHEINEMIYNRPAPKFYMSVPTGVRIYYNVLNRKKEQANRRLKQFQNKHLKQ